MRTLDRQDDLFGAIAVIPRSETPEEAFAAFCRRETWFMPALASRAYDLRSRGHQRVSMKHLFEEMRGRTENRGTTFRLNNNWTPLAVRRLIELYPEPRWSLRPPQAEGSTVTTVTMEILCRECHAVIPPRTGKGHQRQFCELCRPSKYRKAKPSSVANHPAIRTGGDYYPEVDSVGFDSWCRREGFDPVTRTYRRTEGDS